MGVENYLVSVCGSKLYWFLCGGIEIDLILEWGSNWLDFSSGVDIIWFLCEGSNLSFCCSVGIVTCFLRGGSKLTVRGPKLTCFECDDRWTCFLCRWWWSKLTRFLDAGRKSLGFSMSIEIYLVLVWVVDIDSISMLGIAIDRYWHYLSLGIGIVFFWVWSREWLGSSV